MSYDDNGIGDLGYGIEDASYDDLIDSGYNPSNDIDYASTIPEATDPRGWFTSEEALAGPEASQKDVQNAYPKGFDNSTNWGSLLSKLGSNIAGAGKKGLAGLVDKTGSAGGMADILRMLMAIYAYKNQGFAKPPGSQVYQGKIDMNRTFTRTPRATPAYEPYSGQAAMGKQYFDSSFSPRTAATGGIMDLARGGHTSRAPRYLDGPTDGMADKINTSIDDKQPAKLSHGEFVIPADVVSHLGNGNSSAGAKVLYSMMDRVRTARTGNKKQGKQINPAKFTPGGIAAYANGGAVAFDAGGTTGTAETAVSGLAPWAGEYITDAFSKANALANSPYEAYTGALSAGTSPLQEQGFAAAGNLPAYNAATFTNQFNAPAAYSAGTFTNQYAAPAAYKAGTFNTGLGPVKSVEDYMNPYMQNVVDVQNTEARRQADIARVAAAGRMAQAGGYGGSRQAIMESEGNRNLQTLMGDIQAKGSQSAYASALAQRLEESKQSLEQQRLQELANEYGYTQGMTSAEAKAKYGLGAQELTEKSKQFGAGQAMTAAEAMAKYGLESQRLTEDSRATGAKYGLDAVNAQLKAGEAQRAIEQQKVDADKLQWEKEKADPYEKIKWQLGLMQGMPIGASTAGTSTSGYSDLLGLINALGAGSQP